MDNSVKVLEPGSIIHFKEGGIEGLVNCVCIYIENRVLYEVIYWQGGDRKTAWVNEIEIADGAYNKQVGFAKNI